MPMIDFRDVQDPLDFTPVPDGTYLCSLEDVEETLTRSGDAMWRLRLSVENGPYEGRSIFDNLVFSAGAMPRLKLVCSALGLDTSGALDLNPQLLLHRRCRVTVHVEGYVDREGATRKRNTVPFRGYASHGTTTSTSAESNPATTEEVADGDLPF